MISAPVEIREGISTLSVQAVRASATGLELSVRGTGKASEFLIKIPAQAAGGLSIAAGTLIEVTTESVGHVLRVSGKAIGFIPNEVGKSLIFHAPISRNPAKPGQGI